MPEQSGIDRSMAHADLPRLKDVSAENSLMRSAFHTTPQARIGDLDRRVQALEGALNKLNEGYADYLKREQIAVSGAIDLLARAINERTKEISFEFFQNNVVATQTNVLLSNGMSTRGYCAAESGSIVGVTVTIDADRTAGTLTVVPIITSKSDGSVTVSSLSALIDGTNTRTIQAQQDPGTDVFTGGDLIGLRITTTAGWLPITANLNACVWSIYSGLVR